ncbi:MAG: hypothetical protein LBD75_05310 [Candidatus Peribacteria bacterium]|jgi:DNA mismatch repair ATPase MutS|nr:hypothetical protein [Candidatus Peribacteria bacterium]
MPPLRFRSGTFYRTFEEDALFLSCKFGFQILEKGGYKMVGFPLSAKETYLTQLRQENYSYQVVEKSGEASKVREQFEGTKSLVYDMEKATF